MTTEQDRTEQRSGRMARLLSYCAVVPVLCLFLLFSSVPVFGAGGDVLTQYTDVQAGAQQAVDMTVDPNGDVIITGYKDTNVNDYYTVKFNGATGAIAPNWPKTYNNSSSNDDDQAVAVVVDPNDSNSIIVTGFSWDSANANFDIHTIKYSSDGSSVLWQMTFDAGSNRNDYPAAIAVDSSSNIYVAGRTEEATGVYDYLIVKYDVNGNQAAGNWPLMPAGCSSCEDWISSIDAVFDGSNDVIAVTGKAQNASANYDSRTIKYHSDGTQLWQNVYPAGGGTGDDMGVAVRLDANANVIVAGTTKNTTKDLFVVKYGSVAGAEFWTSPVGSEYQIFDGGGSDEPRDLWVDSLGAVYVTGHTFTNLIDMDIYTAKFTDNGIDTVTKEWEDVFNYSDANDDDPRAIAVDENGDVYVTGIRYDKDLGKSDFLTIKYKKGTGNVIWSKIYDGASNLNDEPVGIGFSNSTPGDVIVGGWTEDAVTGYDYYAVKYEYGQLDRPTNLTATFNAIDKIDLAWTDNSSNEWRFQLQRCAAVAGSDCPGADYAAVLLLNADTVNYQDTGLNRDTQYYYRIRACTSPCVTEPDDFSDFSNDGYAVTTDISYSGPAYTFTYDYAGYSDVVNAIDTLSVSSNQHPVVTGYSSSSSNMDYYTVMLDRSDLTEMWSKRYDDVNYYDNEATSIAVDSDDNVIVSGWSRLYSLIVPPPPGGYSNDFYTIRYDSAGNEYWGDINNPGIVFDGSSVTTFSDDYAVAAAIEVADPEDNIIIAGHGNESGKEDMYLIKYDPDGNLLWGPVKYDRGDSDFPSSMAVNASGDIFVTGRSHNGTDYDYFTAKYRGSDGQLMWPAVAIYSGGNGDDRAWAIAVDSAGDVYVTGESMNAAGNKDYYTIKYLGGVGMGNGGSVEWEERLGGLAGDHDIAKSIAVDPVDGDVVVAGTTVTRNGDNDFFVTRYRSTDGAFVWTPEWRILDRPGTNDEMKAMGMDLSGNVHVTGDSTLTDPDDELTVLDVDALSVLYDHEGSFVSGTIYQGATESLYERASAIAVNTYGEAFIGGETTPSGDPDYLVMKIEGDQLQVPIPFTAVEHYKTVDLAWVDNSEDEVNYVIQRQNSLCPILDPDTADEEFIMPANSTTYTDDGVPAGSGLTPDTDYCFRIRTWKSATEYSRWVEIAVHTVELPAPEDLITTTLNTTGIYLEWTDTTSSEDKFNIERCIAGADCPGTLATNDFAPLGTAPAVSGVGSTGSYRDTTVCENTTYYYRVNAEKDGSTPYWTSDWVENSSTQVYEPKMGQTSAKAVPTGLDATEISEVQLDIFWTDNTIDENGFYIWRCEVGTDCPPDKTDEIDTVGLELDSSVKLLLHMDDGWDGAVSKVRDSSAGSNDGIEYNGAANVSAAPRAGLAGSFDGIDDYLEWTTDSFLPSGSNLKMTVEFWFRHNPLTSTGTIIEQWDSADNNDKSWDVQATTAGKINFRINDKGSGSEYTCTGSTGVYDDGNWHHFVGVFDDTTNNMDTYIDGSIHCNGSTSYNLGPDNASSHFHIGAKKNGASYNTFYKGEIDNVVIYDRALTSSEAADRFNSVVRYSDLTSSLVPDTTYRYRVVAYKPVDASCGLPGNEWTAESADSLSDVTTDLLRPDNLQAVATNSTRIDITWSDRTASETGFTIQRCVAGASCPGGDFADIATVGANITKYADTTVCTNVSSAITYHYRVRADKTAATGWPTLWSVSASAQISAVTAPDSLIEVVSGQTTESQIELQWTDNTTDETGFVLERCKGTVASGDCDGSPVTEFTDNQIFLDTVPSGNVLLLNMDEPRWDGDSGEVIDESGSGNHGTAVGGADIVVDGVRGKVGSFDGSNDYVSTPLNIDQGGSKSYTFEAWAYPTSGGGTEQHVISSDNGSYDWALLRYGSEWHVYTGSTRIDLNIGITLNDWQHIAAVFIPGTGVRVYKNGTEFTTTSMGTTTADSPITIGRRAGSGNYFFSGRIDDAAVYDRALTKDEITVRYQQGISNIRTYLDNTGLRDNQTYTYRIKAYKIAPDPLSTCAANRWDSGYSSLSEVDTDVPVPPDGLTVNALSSTDVEIKWTDHTTSEEGFEVQRCVADTDCPGTDFAKINDAVDNGTGVTGEVVFLDDKACYNTTYWYQVNAWKTEETGPPLIPAWATTFSVPSASDTTDGITDPDTPTATTVTETQIDLTWKDRTADETGFKIERCLHNPPTVDCDNPNPGDFVEQSPPFYTLNSVLTLHMDETAGTWNGTADEVKDSSGNGNHGYRSGQAQVVTGGKYINAGTFDGSGDYIRINHDSTINPSDAITVEAWVKRNGSDTWNGSWNWVSKRNAYLLGGSSGNRVVRFYIYDGSWQFKGVDLPDAASFDIKEWHHYAGTYDGANIRLYIDGVEQGTPTSWAGTINADTGELNIGRDDGQNSYHNGDLDDVVIYDYALTDVEIQQRYQHGAQNYDPLNGTDYTTRSYSDTGLLIDNIYYYRIYAYKDMTCNNCCNAGVDDNSWATGYISVIQNTQPPAPGNLRITYIGTTELGLAWDDNTSGETGFEVQRCEGTAAECDDVPSGEFEASAGFWSKYIDTVDLEAYTDDEVCENTTYYYRVRSKNTGAVWSSAWSSIISETTNPKVTPTGLTADQVSETEIDLEWNESVPDETGFIIRRCQGSGTSCDEVVEFTQINTVGANIKNYYDKGLTPNTQYTYWVSSFKTAVEPTCDWESSPISAVQTTDSLPTAGGINLQAAAANTTEIDLSWNDIAGSETGYVIEKCTGSCSPTTAIDSVAPDVTSYSDITNVCNAIEYNYRIMVGNEGLSNHEGACWTRSKTLTVTNFQKDYPTQLTIAYDGDMKSDFSDVRFYDSFVNAELPYWISSKTDGVSATVYVRTFSHDSDPAAPGIPTIIMYYGNANAASASDALRTFDRYDPARADINNTFSRQGQVLSVSSDGQWDDIYVYDPYIIKENSTSYKMWFTGNNGVKERIGYATSADGSSWSRNSANPVLRAGAATTWDDYHVGNASVIVGDGTYKMWYSGYDGATWRIGYATSSDGISWTKYPGNNCGTTGNGCIFNIGSGWESSHVRYPEVIRDRDGTYKMWYSGHDGTRWRVGYAESVDGIVWNRNAGNPLVNIGSNGQWDDYHIAGASVLRDSGDNKYKMWYSGYDGTRWRIGYAESVDGINWNKYSTYVFNIASGWENTRVGFPAVMRDGDNGYYKMWYSGYDGTRWRIGYAIVRPAKPTASPAPSVVLGTENTITGGIGGPTAGCTATFSNTWTVYSNPVSVTPPSPAAPVLTLSVIDDARIDLNWTETPANTDETRYEIERCEVGTGCTLVLPAEGTVGADVMTYPDSGLLPGTQYEYLVRAHKDASCSWDVESTTATATTSPNTPILDAVTPLNSLVMKIDWTDQSEGEDGFEVWRAIWGGIFVKIATVGPSTALCPPTCAGVTFNDTQGLEPQTTYTYRVRSFRGSDASDFSNELSNSTPYYTTGDSICSP